MLSRIALVGSTLLVVVSLAGCGTPAVGEACWGSPQLGGCVEGAYCVLDEGGPVRGTEDDPSWESYTCRAACTQPSDCPDGFFCESIPTTPSLSACRPRTTTP
ncbi:MAG: hypothetical protein K1X94_30525 [Sandaracinaceae bacterium]|jgi:hypothetical protein|nr:hypothetical protein [Sandaracinaceae bacterium]